MQLQLKFKAGSTNLLLVLLVVFLPSAKDVKAQTTVELMQSTLKVSGLGEETFYYGLAEGDQLLFNFEEVNGKELKEVEITELPSSSKFMDYKTKKIENKSLFIARTGIYRFRFANSALGGRICRIKIQRVPASEATKNFNTTVYWRTLYDTAYVPRQERFLERSDTIVTNVMDQVTKVSSANALNGTPNRSIVDFYLPQGTVAWSYYIGVGNEGKKAYEAAKDKFLSSAAATVIEIPGYGVMGALALTGLSAFNKAQGGDNVYYCFLSDANNAQLFYAKRNYLQYKQGNVVSDASQMKSPLAGRLFLGLLNDNIMEPIDVTVKIAAVQVNQKFAMRTVIDMNITSYQEAYLNN
jgi:hypothetical protein